MARGGSPAACSRAHPASEVISCTNATTDLSGELGGNDGPGFCHRQNKKATSYSSAVTAPFPFHLPGATTRPSTRGMLFNASEAAPRGGRRRDGPAGGFPSAGLSAASIGSFAPKTPNYPSLTGDARGEEGSSLPGFSLSSEEPAVSPAHHSVTGTRI